MRFLIVPLATVAAIAACGGDDAPSLDCGEGAVRRIDGASYCVFRGSARDVMCPPEAPVRIDGVNGVLCAAPGTTSADLPMSLCLEVGGCVGADGGMDGGIGDLDGGDAATDAAMDAEADAAMDAAMDAAGLDPACVANCDWGICGMECPTGMIPCESGCCAGEPTVDVVSTAGAATPSNETALVELGADVHVFWPSESTTLRSVRGRAGSWSAIEEIADPTAADQVTDLRAAVSELGLALLYRLDPASGSCCQNRLGIRGASWVWETVPGAGADERPGDLAADGPRLHVLLADTTTRRSVIRTRASDGGWTLTEVPPEVSRASSLALTADGRFVVGGLGGSRTSVVVAWQQDGAWMSHDLGMGRLAAVAASGGVIHAAFVNDTGEVVYARSDQDWNPTVAYVADVSTAGGINQFAMDIDPCGRPHFAVWDDDFDDFLVRWTDAGWRSSALNPSLPSGGCFWGDGLDLLAQETGTYVSNHQCGWTVHWFPAL